MGKSGRNPQLVSKFDTIEQALSWLRYGAVQGATYRMVWQVGVPGVTLYVFISPKYSIGQTVYLVEARGYYRVVVTDIIETVGGIKYLVEGHNFFATVTDENMLVATETEAWSRRPK